MFGWRKQKWMKNFNLPVLTNQGKFLLLLLLGAFYLMYLYPNNAFYFLVALLLALFVMAWFYSLLALRHLEVTRHLPESIFFGEEIEIGLWFRYFGVLPIYGVQVEDALDSVLLPLDTQFFLKEVPPKEIFFYTYKTRIKKRGAFLLQKIRLVTEFPLGLFRKSVEISCPSSFIVYPALGEILQPLKLPSIFPFQSETACFRKGHSLEYAGVREYRHGDEVRHIHWKLSARQHKPLLKEYYQLHHPQVFLLLDNHLPSVCSQKDRIFLEKAISFCATLTQHFLQQRKKVGFLTYFHKPLFIPPSQSPEQFFKILEVLSRLDPCILSHFEELLAEIPKKSLSYSTLFCVAPMYLSKEQSLEKMKQKIYYLGAKGLSQEKKKARKKIERERKKVKVSRGDPHSYLDHLYLQLNHQDLHAEKLGGFASHQLFYTNDPSFPCLFQG